MKKDENGNIVMEENFFLRYLWFTNLVQFIGAILFKKQRPFEPDYPKNRCTRFWGFIFAPIILVIVSFFFCIFWGLWFALYIIMTIICFVISVFTFPFGFAIIWPWNEEKYFFSNERSGSHPLHPYRRYGFKNEKKFPAPWWFWLPVLLVWPFKGEYFYVLMKIINFIIPFLFNTTTGIIFVVAIFVFCIFLIFRLYGRSFWCKIKEIKKKTCLPIVVIKKQK